MKCRHEYTFEPYCDLCGKPHPSWYKSLNNILRKKQMSSFKCEHCNKPILDSPSGYITECEHYPFEHTSIVKRKSKRAYVVKKKKITIDLDITAQCGEQ